MSDTKYVNKIVYGGDSLIDLTSDTVTESDVRSGVTFHKADGSVATGSSTKDSDTSDATANSSEILNGKSAYVRGSKVEGIMPNNGAVAGVITDKNTDYTIPVGYHDGSGKVGIDAVEKGKLIPANIREGITVLGVRGTMSGSESVVAEVRNVTPATTAQVITPGTGYNYLSQVNVAAIPYTESDNAAGGKTVTIG